MTLKTTPFDPEKYLVDEDAMAAYLRDMSDEGDANVIAVAWRTVAGAREAAALRNSSPNQ